MPAASDPAAAGGTSAKGAHVSNDPPLFNTSARKLDEPQIQRRPTHALTRMREHLAIERALREDKINDSLRDAWVRAIVEFRQSRV